jgi:hypothetical protein
MREPVDAPPGEPTSKPWDGCSCQQRDDRHHDIPGSLSGCMSWCPLDSNKSDGPGSRSASSSALAGLLLADFASGAPTESQPTATR